MSVHLPYKGRYKLLGEVLAFIANKGGVGKTTIVVESVSALHLAYPDKKVLIIDGDAQGNSAVAFNKDPNKFENTLYDCVVKDLPAKDAIVNLKPNLDLLPGNQDLNYFELDVLPNLRGRNPLEFFKKIVNQVRGEYDFIFFDSPPELKTVGLNIINAADYLYIPFVPEKFAVKGIIAVLDIVNQAKKRLGAHAKVDGVIANMMKPSTKLHSNYLLQADIFCKRNGIRLLNTRIPNTIRFADSIAKFGMPHVLADPKSDHSKIYFNLLKEMLDHGTRL
jgi:chromosome partitioning protein